MSLKAPNVAVVTAAILAGTLVGCGSSNSPSGTTASQSAAGAASGSPSASAPATSTTPSAEANEGTIVDINIAGGIVTPTNGQAQGNVGKPIVLKVDSDVSDSLHVHSVPEHTFQVEPRPDQQFEFTVDVPGQVDIELHDLNRTVVTIQVRP
ncbi:hypothetical protein [Mycobacterium sp. 29Ha]|uniref:hypothetical protein n=1 Tax=Mycobacterium sp. 29Ha TaxID=2939268 RepID=UPI002938EA75|nr:hypothetical protein [Mycobacterium sp. 29Ha]MDV3131361.1 hypothetical protein [Mycobacterium sp. 29Ha]